MFGNVVRARRHVEVAAFVSALAARHVSAGTQNQALSALLFLYRDVLGRPLAPLPGLVHAKRPARLTVVLSRGEVAALLGRLQGVPHLMASLMYGSGLRVLECAELLVKDVSFERGEIRIRDDKGRKDRVTMLPARLREPLREHLARVKRQHDAMMIWRAARGASGCRTRCRRSIRARLGLDVAMGVSGDAHVSGSRDRPRSPAPSARDGAAAGGEGGVGRGRIACPRQSARAMPFVRDAFAGIRHGHPNDPGAAGPSRR